MKIIEVRDGFIKFEADKSIYLSSFIQVDGMSKNYIAQVNQLKTFGDITIATAKILFLYDGNGLQNYDNTEPSRDSEITSFTLDILNNSINAKRPVIVGKTLDDTGSIKIDASAFDKKMLISIDDKDMNNMLIRNFSKQFENLGVKTIILDTLGIVNTNKYKAGVDFKLPLDTSSLVFMYESCLNDATAESKSTIVEIFRDLSEYSKTVPFVPFDTLKTIVDDMVDKQHIFKLFVLKNKLAKFAKLGYFASTQQEVENIDKILAQKDVIIDLSGMDILFQNRYLSYIYEKLNEYKDIQVFLETANTVSKKNLKNIISESSVPTTLITHSRYQYLNDIKNMFDNFIIEPTLANNTVFRVYSTFLGSMDKDMYLTAGEAINYIPIVSRTQVIDDVAENSEVQEELQTEQTEEVTEEVQEELQKEQIEECTEEEQNQDEETSTDEEVVNVQDEIIANIDKKSESAIESITESLEETSELDLFDNEEENQQEMQEEPQGFSDVVEEDEHTEEEHTEEADVISEEDLEEDASDDDALLEISDEEENSEEIFEDDLASDLTGVNEEAVNISEVPNEDIVIEEPENDESVSTEELSEEMLDENIEDETVEELILEEDSEQNISDTNELEIEENDSEALEFANDESEETTVELDNDSEILLQDENTSSYEEEEYPQNTTLDVDFTEPKIMPLSGEALNHDFDEIVELDSSEAVDDDIVIDIEDDEKININEEDEQKIINDVDKVYTTMKGEEDLEEISDSDLDLIDELNNDGEELEEYQGEIQDFSGSTEGILEEVHPEPTPQKNDAEEILEHKESSTPIVPLYDADIPQEDMVMSDPIQQGDAVLHAKYGNGVVEKMIKYGNKTLYAINFENIGRRLLDPTLTEIKRV